MRLPIRTRLTLVFAGLMLVVLTGCGVFIYLGHASQLDATIDRQLHALSTEFMADLDAGDTEVLEDFDVHEPDGTFAQILDGDGQLLESSHGLTMPLATPEEAPAADLPQTLEKLVMLPDGPERARLVVAEAASGAVVVVGAVLTERDRSLDGLAVLLWTGGPIVLLLTTVSAWFLSAAALRPVESLRREAAEISEQNLAKRLEVPTTGDEIAGLATTLNTMLSELERTRQRERRFVADASHELRTPLGILKTELELALRRARTADELQAALKSAAEESERLNRLADNLLVLAANDGAALKLKKQTLVAAPLVERALSPFRAAAADRSITIETAIPPDLRITVDPLRIEQAITNLVANAMAHTPDGGSIAVTAVSDRGHDVELSVSDTGTGFPDAFLNQAFVPFSRADSGRSRNAGGAGLGLAIVKGIAQAHGGSATAANRTTGGAIVALRFSS